MCGCRLDMHVVDAARVLGRNRARHTLKIDAPCGRSTALSSDVLLVACEVVCGRLRRVGAADVVPRLVDVHGDARRIIETHGLDGGLEAAGVRGVVQALGLTLLRAELLWSFFRHLHLFWAGDGISEFWRIHTHSY